MKKILLILVALLAFGGSIFAQETHWPEFYLYGYDSNTQLVAFIQIDGNYVEVTDDWANLEVAPYVGGECRGHEFMADYTEEYGDPHPCVEPMVYFTDSNEEVGFQMFDHANGILYEDFEVFIMGTGEPKTILTGEIHDEIWMGDYDLAIVINFTSPASEAEPTTIEGGLWNVESTWVDGEVPVNVDVIINGEVVIPDGCVAYADDITINEGGSLTIEEGGQLYHSNMVTVSMSMSFDSYSSKANPNGYYLIAPPTFVNTDDYSTPVSETGLANAPEEPFDLYYFDGSQEQEEWRNYRVEANNFTDLILAKGYLYANEAGASATWNGYAYPTTEDMPVGLAYTDATTFGDWNLIGNPYTCNAFIDRGYYVLDGNTFVSKEAGVPIAPMKGIFVQATAEESAAFTTTDPSKRHSSLHITLRQGGSLVDNAIISFNNSGILEKFQLDPNHTKIYMPLENKNYAITNAESMGEMPVNFEAEGNGTYTLCFNAEEVSFAYLHLIDNLTGVETDLLQNPSYTFDAKTTDYESRFKLVFVCGNSTNSDTFAFYSNGNWVISNEGNATLQVVDVNGRILKSESVNGCANVNLNAASGIYMLRLVNGDNVKVQKVVVK